MTLIKVNKLFHRALVRGYLGIFFTGSGLLVLVSAHYWIFELAVSAPVKKPARTGGNLIR
jgi:hypothetical protein